MMTTTQRLTRRAALAIEQIVERDGLTPIIELREATYGFFGPDRFDDAVRLLLDERRVCGFCDRDTSTLLSTEHVDFVCYLAPKVA